MMAMYEYELCVGTSRAAAKSEYHSSRLPEIVDTLLIHDLRTGWCFRSTGSSVSNFFESGNSKSSGTTPASLPPQISLNLQNTTFKRAASAMLGKATG